jgi:DNA-binding SARP family transcriptional activator
MRICVGSNDELQVVDEFAVFAGGQRCSLAEGQATTLVKRVTVLGFVGIEQVLEWFWPGEVPSIGKRRLRNLLNRVSERTNGVLVRRNGGLTLDPRFGCDLNDVKAEVAEFENLILGLSKPNGPESELADLERQLLRLLLKVQRVLPNDRYDDVVDEAREELCRRVLLLERARSLFATS